MKNGTNEDKRGAQNASNYLLFATEAIKGDVSSRWLWADVKYRDELFWCRWGPFSEDSVVKINKARDSGNLRRNELIIQISFRDLTLDEKYELAFSEAFVIR
jgi:hypothetical protein